MEPIIGYHTIPRLKRPPDYYYYCFSDENNYNNNNIARVIVLYSVLRTRRQQANLVKIIQNNLGTMFQTFQQNNFKVFET